jgi:hypothetical protein
MHSKSKIVSKFVRRLPGNFSKYLTVLAALALPVGSVFSQEDDEVTGDIYQLSPFTMSVRTVDTVQRTLFPERV